MTASGDHQPPAFVRSRTMHVLLAFAVGGALIGYFIGISRRPTVTGPVAHINIDTKPVDEMMTQPAVAYRDMATQRLGPNRDWSSHISTLVQGTPGLLDDVGLDPEAKLRSLAMRESRRAYNGAPPVVPHPIDQLSANACLVCHEHGLRVENRIASTMPHPYLTNCTQCHVEERSAELAPSVLAANSFAGKPAPFEGARAWPGAPPTIPHTMHMRDNCMACHGLNGAFGVRTTHPWRQSCTQCHAPSSALNQQPGDAARFLPGPVIAPGDSR